MHGVGRGYEGRRPNTGGALRGEMLGQAGAIVLLVVKRLTRYGNDLVAIAGAELHG
jgi:hypothetical protein